MKKCNTCDKIKDFNCFNKQSSTKDGYRGKCKECRKLVIKNYYINNINTIKKKQKKYRDENKEIIILQKKNYRVKNVDIIKKGQKKYRDKNKEIIGEYYIKNKKSLNEKRRIYVKNRLDTNPLYKLKHNIGCLIRITLKTNGYTKTSRTHDILGCTYDEFKEHIESQFEDWVIWDNYGNPKDGIIEENKTWDLDHVIPSSSAITEDDIIKLNHYTNLQPLCSHTNRIIKRGMWQSQLKNTPA